MQCLSREKHSSVSIRPDIVSYNTVCDAIAKSRKKDSAEKIMHLIEEMQQCSIHPDTTTYNTLLSAYIRSGSKTASIHAESVLSNMKSLYERGNDKVKPDLVGSLANFAKSLIILSLQRAKLSHF
jgi:Asp-tRNA(Asn)/Glu-tRNA(Gln) amidotransferase C subunit